MHSLCRLWREAAALSTAFIARQSLGRHLAVLCRLLSSTYPFHGPMKSMLITWVRELGRAELALSERARHCMRPAHQPLSVYTSHVPMDVLPYGGSSSMLRPRPTASSELIRLVSSPPALGLSRPRHMLSVHQCNLCT